MSSENSVEEKIDNLLDSEKGRSIMKTKILADTEFMTDLAKEILALPATEIGLKYPGTLLDFFRSNWEKEVRNSSS